MTKFSVRDRRANNRFFVDNALLRGGWGAAIGPYGISVYDAIALHADADRQSAFPSHQLIADLTGMSRPTVVKMVKLLEKFNIIGIERADGRTHTYYLLDQSEWLPVKEVCTPCKRGLHPPVNEVYTNKTHVTKPSEQNPYEQHGAGAPSRSPPAESKKRKPTGRNAVKAELTEYFSEVTGIPLPALETASQRKSSGSLWWTPVLEIAGWVDDDVGESKRLINAAVARLREAQYTISSPKSILNTARAICGEWTSGSNGGGKSSNLDASIAAAKRIIEREKAGGI